MRLYYTILPIHLYIIQPVVNIKFNLYAEPIASKRIRSQMAYTPLWCASMK